MKNMYFMYVSSVSISLKRARIKRDGHMRDEIFLFRGVTAIFDVEW